jgi:regulator of sigma E protease
VFHLIEAVRGKPIKPEREAMVHLIGMLFLFSLMIFFTYKDIVRIFFN